MTAKNLLFKNSRPLKYFIFSLSCVVFAVMLTSCEQNPTAPNEPPKPPGYQEDIYWPSLADSPWPMYRADPQNTGRSNYSGIRSGVIDWKIDTLLIGTGIVSSQDSTLYFAVSYNYGGPGSDISGLVALNSDGSIKWIHHFPVYAKDWPCTPIIANDGTVYTSNPKEAKFIALDNNGNVMWEVWTGNKIIQSGINIDKEGNLYAVGLGDNGWVLNSISKYGKLNWQIEGLDIAGDGFNSMSFSPDGKTLYVSGNGDGPTINAIDVSTRIVKWKFGESRLLASAAPIIDYYGNIYIISEKTDGYGYLISLDQYGIVRWEYKLDIWGIVEAYNLPAIDKNGNIYFGLEQLISINYNGVLNWKILVGSQPSGSITSPITIDINNKIYFTIGIGVDRKLCVYEDNGNLLFNSPLIDPHTYGVSYSLSIAYNKLLFPSYQSQLIYSLY
ncbi:MAG: PQQ-like beta-propeller repeat protein [Ignavibacteriales bacterium]|nr:PQQ-like beta-propeller repeat protein [Ignavibacteriales bacterium]